LVARFCHIDHRAIVRINVRELAGTLPTEIIRLNNIRSLRIVSSDKAWMDCDFGDSDETAKIVKTVEAEEHAKGVIARALPYPVPGTAPDRRRRSGRAAAFYQCASPPFTFG
jgi:hypothetical protein